MMTSECTEIIMIATAGIVVVVVVLGSKRTQCIHDGVELPHYYYYF